MKCIEKLFTLFTLFTIDIVTLVNITFLIFQKVNSFMFKAKLQKGIKRKC